MRVETVLVCGGRNYTDAWTVWDELGKLNPNYVIHGGARGADSLAGAWAFERSIPVRVFEAEWGKHGKAAGALRNQRMLDEGRPDAVLAFPGGRGTADMVRRARKAGIRVIEVPLTGDSNGI